VATDDRDMPAGAADGGRDDLPAGPPVPHPGKYPGNGEPDPVSGPGPDNDASASAAADQPAADDQAPPGEQARTGEPAMAREQEKAAMEQEKAVGEQAGGDPDNDFEPYLPPGPNPFSSVHPQGTPPYRPTAAGPGVAPEPRVPESRAAEPSAAEPRSSGEAGKPGHAGHAEHGYPPVSPYPPLPGEEELRNGHPGAATHGGASPYPAYRPYGPDDEVAGDALADYGLPSPQAYGLAPPPPPVEPLPDLGAPEQVYRNEPYEPPGFRDGDYRDGDYRDRDYRDDLADAESGPPLAEHAQPASGHRQAEGATGQHRARVVENGRRGIGLRGGAAPADAPLARGPQPPVTPLSRMAPGRGYAPPGGVPSGPQPPGAAPLGSGVPRGPSGPNGPGVQGGPGGAGPHGGPSAPSGPGGPSADGADYPPLPADAGTAQEHETSDSLTTEALLHGKRPAPGPGWRRTVFRATGGLVRVGESASSQRRRELVWRARTPVAGGHHRVAVMSLKGGVGKTTTTVGLGATLATLRGDRVIAVDGNPDRGTLSDKVRLETSATVRDLLNERQQVHRYADVRAFTSQAPSRLEVLASDRDPAVSVAFSEEDYCDVARVLEHYYSICITDCGTGLLHSAMTGVLNLADQIVLVSSPSVDGARSASATLDWLDAHGYGDLVRNAVVALSTVRPRSKSTVDLDRLEQHFAARCRAVVRIPYDPHLEEGAEVELEQLSPATTEAYLQLAATVGDGFAWPRRALQRTAPAYP
jgi:MinD-like ATPase involved in chromosome partitioning or flagellar assembly